MRRLIAIAAFAAAFAMAGAVQAGSPEVTVTLSPDLARQADRTLGVRELEQRAVELVQVVRRQLERQGALEGSTVRLVLTDVKPNRPTFHQLRDRPGLSMHSISIGGAAIEGEVIDAQGQSRRVAYDYFSPAIDWVIGGSTWQDADRAFDTFARRLADGRL